MFIKGINYWSFPGGMEETRPLPEVFEDAKRAGFESVEVTLSASGVINLSTTETQAKEIVKAADDAGIKISSVATGLYWEKSLSATNVSIRDEAISIAKKELEIAAWLGADAVLVIPGSVDVFFDPNAEVVDYSDVWNRATESINSLIPMAESLKVSIGIENVWNKFLVGPVEMRDFIDQFDNEFVGCYLDVGNSMLTGYPEHWIRLLGKRIKRVHLKDFRRDVGTASGFVDLLAGDVNWPAVIDALNNIGYEGHLTAEMIPGYKYYPETLIWNTSRAMDAILGG